MTDGWVIFDFDPTISDVFPTKGTSDWSLPEIVIPRISEYITFTERTRTLADGCWMATLHPEEAISLSHRTSVDFFENGETWQIKQAIRFPISSV